MEVEEEADFVVAVEGEVNSMTLIIRVTFIASIARSSVILKHIVGLSKRTKKKNSNHMIGVRSLFRDLDESQKSEVRLGEALVADVYRLNISPTKAILNQTPYEAWTGRTPRKRHGSETTRKKIQSSIFQFTQK
ncbi:hypothetical protein KY290_025994 [Solanum tuberosum]|uniref:Uncharacterized protein n=1 Tax=Solanum tuberosum TaxID=4113 RepID=A0ABQ7UWU2_SOLTU|nr:hypothetical protein KY289_025073 [Solanum tuberosum]KAH0673781.1 hypothetical protein KY284_024868 [Solanum tuberosum]KAH0677070.1 hypothetical protein KY285_024871 [Solanum tuberosum]KAH0755724.1 hypothetical protein KY290_025994 [Solanum tuberosum]